MARRLAGKLPFEGGSVRVTPRKDRFEISDAEIQALLKAHVEAQTGRKVLGSVLVNVSHERYIGELREEYYTAVGVLEDKA